MFGRAIWDKLPECILENFEMARVKCDFKIFKNHDDDLSQISPENIPKQHAIFLLLLSFLFTIVIIIIIIIYTMKFVDICYFRFIFFVFVMLNQRSVRYNVYPISEINLLQ